MGYMRHHAIVVTSYDIYTESVYKKAKEVFIRGNVSNIVDSQINGYRSFFIAPDGSKENWDASDEGDSFRDKFIEWLEANCGGLFAWAEIQYGDSGRETKIVRCSDDYIKAHRREE